MKYIFLIALIIFGSNQVYSQRDIEYSFRPNIQDSIAEAVLWYASAYKKSRSELCLYAYIKLESFVAREKVYSVCVIECESWSTNLELYNLVKISNRKLRVDKEFFLPVVVHEDMLSVQFQEAGIFAFPYGGRYFKVHEDKDGKQSVLESRWLF